MPTVALRRDRPSQCARRAAAGILVVVSLPVVGGQEISPPQLAAGPSVIDRFLQRHDPPPNSYRAARRLEAHNHRFKAQGWMEVTTELSSSQGLTWTVIDEGGSNYIRNKVLRKALEAEAAAIRNGDQSQAALTDANYTFSASDSVNDDTVTIRIEPRRRDVFLVSGLILLRRDDADLVQIEGRLSKTPSFWTSSVEVMRRYERKNGIRVPVKVQSTANVKIAGQSEFLMTYSYTTVNGQPVAEP